MKKLLLALALTLVPSLVYGQCTGVFQPNMVCGRGATSGPPAQVSVLSALGNLGPGEVWNNPTGVPAPAIATAFPVINGTLTLVPPASTLNKGLLINQAVAGAVPAGNVAAWNQFNIGDGADSSLADADSSFAIYLQYAPGGANSKGSKIGLFVHEIVLPDSATPAPSVHRDFVGISSQVDSNQIMPVTGIPASMFAFAGIVRAAAPSTGFNALVGAEIQVAPDVAGISYAIGWNVVYSGTNQASTRSVGYQLAALQTGFQYGIGFTNQHGFSAVAPTGTVMAFLEAQTVDTIFDFSLATVTTNIFSFKNMSLNGSTANPNMTLNGSSSAGYAAKVNGLDAGVIYADAGQVIMGAMSNVPLVFITNSVSHFSIAASGIMTGSFTPGAGAYADGIVLTNPTGATAGNQQHSPNIHLTGQGWKTDATAASQTIDWRINVVPLQGPANPSNVLVFGSQINNSGFVNRVQFTDDGANMTGSFSGIGGGAAQLVVISGSGNTAILYADGAQAIIGATSNIPAKLYTNNTQRVYISPAGGVLVGAGTTDHGIGNLASDGYMQTGVTTVGSLPACNAGRKGARFFVTDQNTAVAYHGAVTGGGANQQGVTCDGTNWYQS